MEPLGALGLGIGSTAVAGLAYSAGYEVRAYTLREVAVPVLPAGAEPVRVLHISDLHMTAWQQRKQQWLRDLARLQPDLVVATGDFTGYRDAVQPVLSALEPLSAHPGVYVFGSNDYYAPTLKNPARYLLKDNGVRHHSHPLDWESLDAGLQSAGWHNLTHRRLQLRICDTDFEFRGVDDPHLELDRYSEVAGPAAAGCVGVGVTHAPYLRVLDGMAADGLPLILAGHTHGGQLCLPGYGALVTNCDLDTRRAKGLSRHRGSWLHVSAGLGTNPFTPVRFACRPEATLLELRPAG